ncbi:DUF742 domain-containing protein [Micromonospora carbonacea]|uniref:DUF742 domain-containing protein n=1 Tax=Micromonospora carbonacea TaxID=47853 RepID=A0A1C5A7R6_9ACTN|nr:MULTISPECIES: DUF742 domain-containing protein [Micromonospora]MBB5828827.1 hypothetical protein [Micromonospora carbonacea]MDG4817271.1 DUF742 domain-containing protein [Micromonospora sp. WMMD956]QLD23620.1 DUF742 domain-containing protein [Micromonospora carbonacea]WFE59835.1 DUF742 domain-containing protein [Micromonospora sp. WMMD712]SCF41293.1 Protein of unknown function (DUF742) [Micromonospora carbonacea]
MDRDEPTGALVRPYAVTRGRTRPRLDIALEALVETTVRGRATAGSNGGQGREHQYIAALCDGRVQSLAEIAARMQLPLGVARVLIADMATDGLVAVHEPTILDDSDDAVGTELLERVLSGLRRL